MVAADLTSFLPNVTPQVNFVFRDDPSAHIMEIQFMHEKMLLQRKRLGGHNWYACYRTLSELVEVGRLQRGYFSVSFSIKETHDTPTKECAVV